MTVSVLIAAYQAGAYLPAALACLPAQTHSDWELIVVEDGSRDATESLVTAFAAAHPGRRIVYFNFGENRGVAAARNQLLRLAAGEAAAFLDADDRWEPTHLALAVTALEGGADIAVANVRAFDLSDGSTIQHYPAPPALLADPVAALLAGSPIVTSSAVILRLALARQVGDFDPVLRVGEDRDYWLRAALAGARFAALVSTCHYAKHPGSTMARTVLVAEQSRLFALKYLRHPDLDPRPRRRALAQASLNLARLVRASTPGRAARLALEAWRHHPADPRPLALAILAMAGTLGPSRA